jgi:hypothetical protein
VVNVKEEKEKVEVLTNRSDEICTCYSRSAGQPTNPSIFASCFMSIFGGLCRADGSDTSLFWNSALGMYRLWSREDCVILLARIVSRTPV